MNIIEQIKAEIERRIRSIENCPFIEAEFGASEKRDGKLIAYKDFLSFLSTLESEKPSGRTIEEPIDGGLYASACGIKNATGKLEKSIELEEEIKRWWSEEYMKNSEGLPILPIVQGIARHFAQWGAEHLKK